MTQLNICGCIGGLKHILKGKTLSTMEPSSVKTHITIVTQTFPPRIGGMEAVMSALAERFSKLGHEVTVFTDRVAPQSENYRIITSRAIKLIRPIIKKLLVKLYSDKHDLVICDSWKSVRAVPSHFSELVLLAHGQEYLNKSKHNIEINKAIDRAKWIICSSKASEKLVHSISKNAIRKTFVIYPTYMLNEIIEVASLKHTENEKLALVSVCRLDRRKGLYNVMSALSALDKEGLDFHWTIGGNGPEYDGLVSECKKLNLQTKVIFAGSITASQKANLLRKADLFVMPSYIDRDSLEGFGISYIEAAAVGVPSLGGVTGGAPEAVCAPDCGWICDGSDPDSVYQTLKAALRDRKELRSRGENALRRYNKALRGDIVFRSLTRSIGLKNNVSG